MRLHAGSDFKIQNERLDRGHRIKNNSHLSEMAGHEGSGIGVVLRTVCADKLP